MPLSPWYGDRVASGSGVTNFGGAAQYDAISIPANYANYLANFASLPNGVVSVTFTGAVVQNLCWASVVPPCVENMSYAP